MGCHWNYVAWSAILLIPALVLVLSRKKSRSYRLPPGPSGWPILGNIFDLGTLPHQTTAAMQPRYGPVVWLKIGSIKTIVILSAKAAAPYGTYWRVLRRICTEEMFTYKRINETAHARRKCVDAMLQWIDKEANYMKKGSGIKVARFIFLASFNIMGNLMLSHDLADPESTKASEFFTLMKRILVLAGRPNISDIFPWLRWLDLQGLRKKAERDLGKAIEVASTFVRERMKEHKKGGEYKKDFFEVLLEFEGSGKDEPSKLSEHQINMFLLTTSTSMEWALTELLRNPESMTRVKAEITDVVGNMKFEESDIDNLHYMQAVFKETLRLHRPVPLLIPRRAIQDTSFIGYDIPEDTQVFVNVWAVGRDSECWEDPLAFNPERFLSSKPISRSKTLN